LQAHYNIAPTDTIDVVRSADGGATELVMITDAGRRALKVSE
jgi:hypothetical protein